MGETVRGVKVEDLSVSCQRVSHQRQNRLSQMIYGIDSKCALAPLGSNTKRNCRSQKSCKEVVADSFLKASTLPLWSNHSYTVDGCDTAALGIFAYGQFCIKLAFGVIVSPCLPDIKIVFVNVPVLAEPSGAFY